MIKSDSKLAAKWGANVRTIRRWRKAGAPLSNAKAMAQWLTSRRHLPPGTSAILFGQDAQAVSSIAAAAGCDPTERGAAKALHRLEEAERTTYRLLQAALKLGSAPAIKTARENWLAIGDQLRQYDRQVERDRRDAGELVPRSQVERYVATFVHLFRLSIRPAVRRIVVAMRANADDITIRETLREQLWDNALSVLAMAGSKGAATTLPGWFIAAATRDLDGTFADAGEAIVARMQCIEKLLGIIVGANAKQGLAKLGLIEAQLCDGAAGEADPADCSKSPA